VTAPSPLPSASPLDRTFLNDLPGVTTLILVRHGRQHFPKRDRPIASDWVDPPLSVAGVRQAELVGRSLAGEHIDVVYSSHLVRAHDTARQVAGHHGLEPVVNKGLREVEVFRDVPAGYGLSDVLSPEEVRLMQERFIVERRWDVYPYSESSAECRTRVVSTIEELIAGNPGRRIVVACHSGVINAYVGHVLGLQEDMFFRPGHASVTRLLALDERRVIQTLNETHHLAAADPALVTV